MGHGSLFSRQLEFPIYHHIESKVFRPSKIYTLKFEVGGLIQKAQTLSQSIIHLEPGWGLQLLDIALPKAFDQSIVQTQVGFQPGEGSP